MDLLTVVGISLAIAAITAGQYIDGGQIAALVNGPALLIVLGGTLGAVMVQTPGAVFRRAFRLLSWAFFPPKIIFTDAIRKVVVWSRLARKGGLLALENSADKESDHFAKKGLGILVQGCSELELRRIMEVELENREEAQLQAASVFESMGGYSPTIGIIGAILGLIEVMRHLNDPSEIGAGIAVAFVATIYGIALANLVFLPIANKLKATIQKHYLYHEMILEGLASIAQGEHPLMIEKKLRGYLYE